MDNKHIDNILDFFSKIRRGVLKKLSVTFSLLISCEGRSKVLPFVFFFVSSGGWGMKEQIPPTYKKALY